MHLSYRVLAFCLLTLMLSAVAVAQASLSLDTDMSISMSDFPDPVVASYSVYYDLVVTNEGPQDTTGVMVTITLPAQTTFVTGSPVCDHTSGIVTCSLGAMNVTDTIPFQIEVKVNNDASGTLTYTATVTSDLADLNNSNDTATELTDVTVPLPPPTPLAPGNGVTITDNRPTFIWSAVPGAYAYEFALDMQDPILSTALTFGTSFRLPGPMVYTTYYWQVRAIDINNIPSPWTPVQTLIINSPPNVAPMRNAYNTFDVSLTWTPVNGATAYQIQFSDSPTFLNYAPISPELPAGKQNYTLSFGIGTWYWHVRARRANGQWSNWSTTESFQVIVP